MQRSLELEDAGAARLELGRLLSEKAAGADNPADRTQLELAAHQQLRLAIDRDPDLVDAIGMLVEPGWSRGLEGVLEAIQPLLKAYPDNWAVWRVMGDAYATEDQWPKAIEKLSARAEDQGDR